MEHSKLNPDAIPILIDDLVPIRAAAEQLGMKTKALNHWRERLGFGVVVRNRVYFSQNEIAQIAARASTSQKVRLAGPAEGRRARIIRKEIWMRPELWEQAQKQAKKVGLSFDDYIQLLIYGHTTEAFRKKLNPPLRFA